ncbi:hypothetical protein V7S43_016863 [Phytophthora oleae]|uniref:Uncharacterized protein n=1 Tax=Phytophthora oleae TaxID=2107226 RepID=A0ABD3EWA0_9STRA
MVAPTTSTSPPSKDARISLSSGSSSSASHTLYAGARMDGCCGTATCSLLQASMDTGSMASVEGALMYVQNDTT